MLRLQQGFATGEMGFGVSLHGSNPNPLMSALCQKQTLPALFDHLSTGEQRRRHLQAERPSRLQVDDELEFR